MALDLPARQRIDLFFSNLAGRLGLDRRVVIDLVPHDGYYLARIPGHEIALPSAKRWRHYKRGWGPRQARLLHQFGVTEFAGLRAGDTVIDIGANLGDFSVAVAAMGVRVHAIEGDPLVFRCLTHNTARLPNVTRHESVIWKDDTVLTFFSEPTEANSSVFKPLGSAPTRAIEVRARRLDTLAAEAGIGEVALLKCDAEGAEPEVIEGARGLLARTRMVAFDTGAERMGEETSDDCEKLLRDLGFRVMHDRRPNRKITFGFRE